MKLWVLLSDDPDGGDYFEGVFSTEELAMKAEDELAEERNDPRHFNLHHREVELDAW